MGLRWGEDNPTSGTGMRPSHWGGPQGQGPRADVSVNPGILAEAVRSKVVGEMEKR
jgi:hypothetical protein